MSTAKTPSLIGVITYGIDGQVLSGSTVTLTHSSGSLVETSNSKGEVIFNLADLDSYSVGDSITVTSTKATKGTVSTSITVTSKPQKVNLTLAETSDLNWVETDNRHVLNFSLLTTFDGEKVTNANPLPVSSDDLLDEPAITNTYDSSNRLSTQTITIRGTEYKRTFTYTGNNFQFTSRSAWIKQ